MMQRPFGPYQGLSRRAAGKPDTRNQWLSAVLANFLIALILLPAPALAEPPDIADVVAVHAELRALDGIPAYDWPLGDGVFDCDDFARWARAALEARGWPRDALVIWAGRDAVFGDVHAVLCAAGATAEPVCLDRRQNALVPLSSYGPGWRVYPWQ